MVMSDYPRGQVLEEMARARWFLLLSTIYDAGPRAVIEAQILGCEVVLENVGHFDEPPDVLAERIRNADRDFWGAVLA
jgi:hypothetical protein